MNEGHYIDRCLFIGGPMHEQFVDVAFGTQHLSMNVPNPPLEIENLIAKNVEPLHGEGFETVGYTRRNIVLSPNHLVHVYAEEGLTESEVQILAGDFLIGLWNGAANALD